MSVSRAAWGRSFDPDRLALLELRMWKAYYRRQPIRLFALLVQANHEQASVSWPRAMAAALLLARAGATFGRTGWDDRALDPSRRDDPAYLRDIARGYRVLGLPDGVDAREIARRELRWWTRRREIGLSAGHAAGTAIAELYSELYGVPMSVVAEAGRLRGQAAEFRDRGAAADPAGATGKGAAYWPEVGRILLASYRSLKASVAPEWTRALEQDTETATVPANAHARGGWHRRLLRRRGRSNEYSFTTTWLVPGTPEEVSAILAQPASWPCWWPAVYSTARVLERGDERGLGQVVELQTRGWLPYTLRWRSVVTESDPPHGFSIRASGDVVGRGIWTLTPDPAATGVPLTRVVYDWRIAVEKPLLKRFSLLAKPVFAANHRWAMATGQASIVLELERQRAAGDTAVLAAIPEPPAPTFRLERLRRLLRRARPVPDVSAETASGIRPAEIAVPGPVMLASTDALGNSERAEPRSIIRRRWRSGIRP